MMFGSWDFSDLGLRIFVALEKGPQGFFQEDK